MPCGVALQQICSIASVAAGIAAQLLHCLQGKATIYETQAIVSQVSANLFGRLS
jgi:hypothetical protein